MERSKQPLKDFFRLFFKSDKKDTSRNCIIGMGSIFVISGNYFKEKEESSDESADLLAMYSDWEAVGNDLKKSLKFHLSEIKDPKAHESAKRKLEHSCFQ